MTDALREVLEGKEGNYIMPFFWQHGEEEAVLRDYMRAIHEANIGAVCVEARPHPEFAGDGWWHDMDIILEEARKRDMKVWVLDDVHFPTGQAAGKMKDREVSLQKQYLMFKRVDLCGPMRQAELAIGELARTVPNPMELALTPPMLVEQGKPVFSDDSLVRVIAYPYTAEGKLSAEAVDLTDAVEDGILYWDVPGGRFAVYVFYLTRNGGGKSGYINMLDEDSCRVQVEEVYEPHYEHYKEYFGNTLAGFFSDEPCLGNTNGFDMNESIGRRDMPLPWNKDMPGLLLEKLGSSVWLYLAALWAEMADPGLTARLRYAYMDAVTRLVQKHFSEQLGGWCEEHGVEYIGHIVEDKNQHSRLGSSQGHFFRSMAGQHMAGIDDIGGQVLPEGEHVRRQRTIAPGATGEFYHFELGKLGASLGHIDPKKQGRTMCELFGAYGWSEGVRLEKYLTDHFLVRGINRFVPHAFSPKAFPDPDCPPHFYAHGIHPQYRHFGKLMKYMNRMSHLLDGGVHVAPAAVLYHGEAEWTGECMFDEKVACELMEHQVDLDIIPSDVFACPEPFHMEFDGQLHVNQETYRFLVIPYAQFLTEAVAEFVIRASGEGFPVVFVGGYPKGICDVGAEKSEEILERLRQCPAKAGTLERLADWVKARQLEEIALSVEFPQLRYYHYEKDGKSFYVFSNESCGRTFEGKVKLPVKGNAVWYDAMENQIWGVDIVASPENDADGMQVQLGLDPYQLMTLVVGADAKTCEAASVKWPFVLEPCRKLGEVWQISAAEASAAPEYVQKGERKELESFGKMEPDFSGTIRYETEFTWSGTEGNEWLEIEDAYEGVEVFVNGKNVGMAICPPYRFELKDCLLEGRNKLRIEVATTLYRKMAASGQGGFILGAAGAKEPTGVVGEVWVKRRV